MPGLVITWSPPKQPPKYAREVFIIPAPEEPDTSLSEWALSFLTFSKMPALKSCRMFKTLLENLRYSEAGGVVQCLIPPSISSCLENPQWWFLYMLRYLIETFGVWPASSLLWDKIFRKMTGYTRCFLELKIANRCLHLISCRGRATIRWMEHKLAFATSTAPFILASIFLTSGGFEETRVVLQQCSPCCLPALIVKMQVSRERGLQALIRDDGIPGVLGQHALPSKMNGSLTTSPYAFLLILTQELTDWLRSCN